MEKCSQCLCVPAQCTQIQCLVCDEKKCSASTHSRPGTLRSFFSYSKAMFAAALGIEVLCISFAELGANAGLYVFGINPAGIAIAYVMGYALAGVATFLTILGRSGTGDARGCCSVLEHANRKGFYPNFAGTIRDFASGLKKLAMLRRQPELKSILKTSAVILVTAESACILVAETVDLVLYQYSILLSVPLALLAGAFTIVAPRAYKKARGG
ncbi:MAG TPA: hypothetical protein VFZ05_00670 [Nitrososphaera sp.]